MTQCPTCGFDLWKYNSSTLTCKHGHRFGLDGNPAPEQPAYTPAPRPSSAAVPVVDAVTISVPLGAAAIAGAVAAIVVDVLLLVIA